MPTPLVLPISSVITGNAVNRRSYDQALESFSRPLMRRYAQAWRFGPEKIADDGIRYNLQFDAYADALPTWRSPI